MLGLRRGQYGADAGIKERSVGADAVGADAGIKERSVWS